MRKGVKLPGFMNRGAPPAKPSWEPSGTISFSTNQENDISGLDEAMQNISQHAKANAVIIPQNVNPASIPASSGDAMLDLLTEVDLNPDPIPPIPETPCSNEDYELAIEATTITDDGLTSNTPESPFELPSAGASVGVSWDLGQPSSPVDIVPIDMSYPDGHLKGANRQSMLSPSASFPDMLETLVDVSEPKQIDGKGVAPPSRPPPFKPRSASNMVAPADIHALLDSFHTPGRSNTTSAEAGTKPPIISETSNGVTMAASLDEHPASNGEERQARSMNDRVFTLGSTESVSRRERFRKRRSRSRSTSQCSGDREPDHPVVTKPVPPIPPVSLTSPFRANAVEQPRLRKTKADRTAARRARANLASGRHSKSSLNWKIFLISSAVLLVAFCYLFSAFCWGLGLGILGTLGVLRVYTFLNTTSATIDEKQRCHVSGLPFGQLCCSFHCPSDGSPPSGSVRDARWPVFAPALPPLRASHVPQLRDLPSLAVPHMSDEDPYSAASGGPLASGLGFKFDKIDQPIYKSWLNQINHYDPETHHVSRTYSIFITLEGTQLRLQRPRRNLARRSMWNEDLPASTSSRLHQQRIYDLLHARVTLVPPGLISKRLWSKKYPIAITLPVQPANKRGIKSLIPHRPSLPPSTSVPNMATVVGPAGSGQPLRPSPEKVAPSVSSSSGIQPHDASDPSHLSTQSDSFDEEEFSIVSPSDVPCETLFLFGRTSREKEAWFRRLRAASLGVPLLWTPQLAVQQFLATNLVRETTTETRSDDETRSEQSENYAADSVGPEMLGLVSAPPIIGTNVAPSDKPATSINTANLQFGIPGSREPLYVNYIRYMAKFMPANWLLRGAHALRLNVNHISCDPNVLWLNAILGRVFWDFLREAYWLERVRDKIQAKLKKIHLPPFIRELTVIGTELGTELPVIRRVGRPFLDTQGLWLEVDVAYAGGFSLVLETSVNLLRWNQRNRLEREAANIAEDVSAASPSPEPSETTNASTRRSNRLGAFVSDEEDSVDSTTDSDTMDDPSSIGQRRSSGSLRTSASTSSPGSLSQWPQRLSEDDRSVTADKRPGDAGQDTKGGNGNTGGAEKSRMNGISRTSPIGRPLQLPSVKASRKGIIRMVDRIARSSYFQKAVDNKLVQRGMELLSNTPIVLQLEIEALSGTLLINIPPPQSDRLWYGFRPSPQLRVKARPRVGEKVVTMSRILEWIENRVTLEFQRLVVLPNMDDISIPLLLSDITAGEPK